MAPVFIHPAKPVDTMDALIRLYGKAFSYVKTKSGNVVMIRNPKFKQPKGFV